MKWQQNEQGVALAMLLWIVAALTLLVSGVVAMSRTDVQLTALQLAQARAEAAAEGAAHLLMRDLHIEQQTGDYDGQSVLSRRYQLDGLAILGRAFPVSGLVNINSASPQLLADLFHYTGGLRAAEAETLAQRVVQWRGGTADPGVLEAETSRQNSRTFAVLEDLLKVNGLSRELYDRVSPALSAQQGGQSGINPAAAPRAVLLMLAEGDQARVDFVVNSRQDVLPGEDADYSGLATPHLAQGGSASVYCLEIEVTVSENRVFKQRIWVSSGSGGSALPWQIRRMQPATVQPREG